MTWSPLKNKCFKNCLLLALILACFLLVIPPQVFYTSDVPIFSFDSAGTHSTSSCESTSENVEDASRLAISAAHPRWLLTIDHDTGRLGNKLFKYASLLGVARATGRHPFVLPYTEDLDLTRVFNLTHVESHASTFWWPKIVESSYAYFDTKFTHLPGSHVRIAGYMQSWKYFDGVKDEIRREFSLSPLLRLTVDTIMADIRRKFNQSDVVFVGVHVRQRDDHSNSVTCEAPVAYFRKAFLKMSQLVPGKKIVYLVAGNNLAWCRAHLSGTDTVVLGPSQPELHFGILSSCDHVIMTVGSYGWWAGWLSGGHVIFYKKFPLPFSFEAMGFAYDDYYPPSWTGLND